MDELDESRKSVHVTPDGVPQFCIEIRRAGSFGGFPGYYKCRVQGTEHLSSLLGEFSH